MTATRENDLVAKWREVLACHSNVGCALESALQHEHNIGLSEFEALDRLVDVDCEKRLMRDLAADMYLSQSALSRTVARLERDGLVERCMCDLDRRALFVRLTDLGRDRHRQARDTHRAVLAEHLTV